MTSAEDILKKHVPDNCIWDDMNTLDNCPIRFVLAAMEEYRSLGSAERREIADKAWDYGVQRRFGFQPLDKEQYLNENYPVK